MLKRSSVRTEPKSNECACRTVSKDSENTKSIEWKLVITVLVLMVVEWN